MMMLVFLLVLFVALAPNAPAAGLTKGRAVAAHMFKNYDRVLKIDSELGNKKVYDPRWYVALAEKAMAERVKQAASDLRAGGNTFAS